ncbi:MAG TPA: glycosyltransferase family 1 protein [Bacteroidota bacterium]|nr:glycosyltransferase family 1 protein [Bacteroidota bacterium]
MKIAIDGRTIRADKRGVGGYTHRLVKALLEVDKRNQYVLFLSEPHHELKASNLTSVVENSSERFGYNRVWENFRLPQLLSEHGVDLYFAPAYTLPLLPRFEKLHSMLPRRWKRPFVLKNEVKILVTIHDAIAAVHPEFFTAKMRAWQTLYINNARHVAHHVIASSEQTKRDLLTRFGFEKNRVSVVYPELDPAFRRITGSRLERVHTKYGLPKHFILFVGTIEPRKNILGLATAYAMLPEKIRSRVQLIVAGGSGWKSGEFLKDLNRLKLGTSIRFLGYVPDEDLPSLYNLAELFVYPSFYEGFGYPPLEAMACGVPVITSNRSSLPEVTRNAAILIDPANISELSDAIKRVLANRDLRHQLRARGLRNIRSFAWGKSAQRLLKVFRRVMKIHRNESLEKSSAAK